MLIRADIHLDW